MYHAGLYVSKYNIGSLEKKLLDTRKVLLMEFSFINFFEFYILKLVVKDDLVALVLS